MRDVLWHRAVGTRLTFLLAGAGVLSVVMLALAVRDHARLASELAWINEAGKVRRASFALLYEATMVRGTEGAERVRAQRALRQHATDLERGLAVLRAGNPETGMAPTTDPGVMTHLASLERRWTVLEPMLEEVAGDGEVATSALDALLREHAAEANAAVERALRADAARARRSSMTAVVLGLLTLVLLIVAIVLGRRMARRTRELALVSTRIAGGELLARAPSEGGDELAALGRSFNAMTSALRERIDAERHARRRLDQVLAEIERVSEEVAASSHRIVEASAHQSAGAGQQAASVAETAAGADRLTRAAADATARAHEVLLGARRSESTGRAGAEAATEAVESVREVRARMTAIRGVVGAAAQRARALAEVVATVDGIAAQTQLVALNATIEASRAGREGRSFSVVASEVKALAERSRSATVRVREILGEIERAIEGAVGAAEAGGETADGAADVVERAGRTIDELGDTIAQAATLAAGIEATVGSQADGISEIRAAVRAIDDAMGRNVEATRQAEAAARELDALAVRLRELLAARSAA